MEACRACGGHVSKAFDARILGRHVVGFFRCDSCRSLQSEQPYWLDEAYQSAIGTTDTGIAFRNLGCQAAVFAVSRIFGVCGPLLDYGGGSGLLCRLLRDYGFDAYLYDKHADPVYARAFTVELGNTEIGKFDLIAAMEVLEHCENPADDIGGLFSMRPRVLLATTVLYRGEGEDWWYLGTETGQHVFFYSSACLKRFAVRYGYHYLEIGSFHIFSIRAASLWRKAILRILLSSIGIRALRIWIAATTQGRYIDADREIVHREFVEKQRVRRESCGQVGTPTRQ